MSRSNILFIILSLCLALVLVYQVAGLMQERHARSRLAAEIAITTRNLGDLPAPDGDLSARLEQAEANNRSARQAVSNSNIDTTSLITLLLKTADKWRLQIDPLSSEQGTRKNVGTGTYNMLPLEINLTGGALDYYGFVADLENDQLFPSLAIEQMTLTVSSQAGTEAGAVYNARLTVSLVERLGSAS